MSLKDQYLSLQASLDVVEEDDSPINVNAAITICNEIIATVGENTKAISPYQMCGLHTKAALILQHHSGNHQHLRTALQCLETVWEAATSKKNQKADASSLFQVDIEEVAFHLYYCMYRLNNFKAALEGLDAFLKSHFGSLTDNGSQFQHLRAQLLYNLEQYTEAAAIYEETLETLNEDIKGASGEDEEAMLTERSEAVTNLTACYASMPDASATRQATLPHLSREEDGGNFEQYLNMAMSSHSAQESNPQWWAETAVMLYEAEAALKRAHEDTDISSPLQAAFHKRLSELSGPLTALRRFNQKPEESASEALWATVSGHLATADPVCTLVLEGNTSLEEDRSFLSDYSTLLLHRGVLIQMLERCSGMSSLKDSSIQCYATIQAIRPRGVVITAVAAVNYALLLSSTGVSSSESQRWHYDALQAVRHASTAPVSQRLTTQQCSILTFNNALLQLHLGNRSGAASIAVNLIHSCPDEGIRTACVALLCEVHRVAKKSKKTKKFFAVLNRKAVAKKLGASASPSSQAALSLVSAQHHAGCFQKGVVNATKHLSIAASELQNASKLSPSIGISATLIRLLLQSPPPANAKSAGILPAALKAIAEVIPKTAAEASAQLSLIQSYLVVLGANNTEVAAAVKTATKNGTDNAPLRKLVEALAAPTQDATKTLLKQAGMWPSTPVSAGVSAESLLNDEVIADIIRRLPNRVHVDASLYRIAGSAAPSAAPATITNIKIRNRKRPCKALATAAKSGTTTRPDPERWIPLRDRPSYQELPARRRRELHRIRAAAEAEKRRSAEKRRLGQQ